VINIFYSIRITIVKDKTTRQSKGVAFVLFLNQNEANMCVKSTNGIQVMILNYHKHFEVICTSQKTIF